MSLQSYIRGVPKAELHVHLDGSIEPATLVKLAERNGVDLPAETVGDLEHGFTYRDFEHFRSVIRACARCLVTSDDYELVTYELGKEMAQQHVCYAEVRFGPTTPHFRGIPQQIYMDGLIRGRRRVMDDFGVLISWVFELGRGPEQGPETWDYTTQVAIEGKDEGVVALGLAGPEYRHPTESFARWFERARAAGLHSAPHAGELAGPESVWGALKGLGAERIGHGVRATEDPALVTYLAEHDIPLEVCPRSNVRLGIYDRLEDHPLPRLYEAGVVVTVNSDDPPLFNTTLSDELATLVDPFDLGAAAIDEIVLNGIRASFLPPDQKRTLEAGIRQEIDVLKDAHLGEAASTP